ncbi:hypothetical protein CDG60_17275 [Acinetobacter chinensis]|uniref:Uncharacterized protein n=1 Tax=Acinetobacter chinensis TaxID=2004650 RepID=A0A3B7M651_9GAMM|nr:hypothetical protein CDG60_17275 [Acinetobacter chinensis]
MKVPSPFGMRSKTPQEDEGFLNRKPLPTPLLKGEGTFNIEAIQCRWCYHVRRQGCRRWVQVKGLTLYPTKDFGYFDPSK